MPSSVPRSRYVSKGRLQMRKLVEARRRVILPPTTSDDEDDMEQRYKRERVPPPKVKMRKRMAKTKAVKSRAAMKPSANPPKKKRFRPETILRSVDFKVEPNAPFDCKIEPQHFKVERLDFVMAPSPPCPWIKEESIEEPEASGFISGSPPERDLHLTWESNKPSDVPYLKVESPLSSPEPGYKETAALADKEHGYSETFYYREPLADNSLDVDSCGTESDSMSNWIEIPFGETFNTEASVSGTFDGVADIEVHNIGIAIDSDNKEVTLEYHSQSEISEQSVVGANDHDLYAAQSEEPATPRVGVDATGGPYGINVDEDLRERFETMLKLRYITKICMKLGNLAGLEEVNRLMNEFNHYMIIHRHDAEEKVPEYIRAGCAMMIEQFYRS